MPSRKELDRLAEFGVYEIVNFFVALGKRRLPTRWGLDSPAPAAGTLVWWERRWNPLGWTSWQIASVVLRELRTGCVH